MKSLVINVFWIWSIMKVYTICCGLAQIPFLRKSGSWDMGQTALSQSDYRIFKSTISLEQNDEKAWIFACWYIFMESRSWLKNIGLGIFKNGYGHSALRTLRLAVRQGKMNERNWILVCWYKFMKAKSYFNNFFLSWSKMGVAF